jgi:hypothetical protein
MEPTLAPMSYPVLAAYRQATTSMRSQSFGLSSHPPCRFERGVNYFPTFFEKMPADNYCLLPVREFMPYYRGDCVRLTTNTTHGTDEIGLCATGVRHLGTSLVFAQLIAASSVIKTSNTFLSRLLACVPTAKYFPDGLCTVTSVYL